MKTWFITGVRTGLGRATAQAALERGDTVVGIVRTEEAAADFAKLEPGRAIGLTADITDRKAVFAAVDDAERATGGIDIVMNNAANQLESWIEEADPDEIRRILESNIMGAVHVTQAFLPYLRKRGKGHFLNMSSMGGAVGWPWVGFYTMTKFAIEGLSESLQQEVGSFGINVSIIEAGGFRTALFTREHVLTTSRIPEYDQAPVAQVRARIRGRGGKEDGDPKKFAQVMLKVVDAENPPQRIAVGADAIEIVLAKAKRLTEQIEAWRDVCSNLDLEPDALIPYVPVAGA